MLANQRITFIGAGAMTESIIAGLLTNNYADRSQITVINKSKEDRLGQLEKEYGVKVTEDKRKAVEESDLLILSMKPKDVEEALGAIQPFMHKQQVIFSVLAGTTTSYISHLIGLDCPVVRVMPNTSAKVAASASAISAGQHATSSEVELASQLFSAIGSVTIVSEEQMDSVTGISGSGPAYFYYILEGLQLAAVESGLSEDDAKDLLVQTMLGAAKRWAQTSTSLHSLYNEVMSPGGTTEAAFSILNENHVQEHLMTGAKAAIDRSHALGQPKKEV
ncbi:pyrroline-5-carboxylate reductase [Geomicrobium halophilum]|uniref:Pyrroline-5-carboxylate reductase n=1 Tax=Geomicrobium halophilum TaxID=549000 RepID=A0A841PKY4_9BACL|nr:pyrroline-5-carboxylate reductase [Geomicrobium halophilum]